MRLFEIAWQPHLTTEPLVKVSKHDLESSFSSVFPPRRLKYRPASDSWELENRAVTYTELVKLVSGGLDFNNKGRIDTLLTEEAWQRRGAALSKMKCWLESIEGQPVDDRPLRRWLKAMEWENTPDIAHEANVVAMKQWIWQVKRGIAEREVVWHVAPIFWSTEGGTGKSYNLRRLLQPLLEFTRNLSVNELGEKFSGRIFSHTLVAFLDEFAGVERSDIAQLKAILTGKPIDSRSMYSESGFYSQNRMSCLGTSNLKPPHNFVDSTGARRFWSIRCASQPMKHDDERMKALDAMDMDAVWCAVSVDDKSPKYTSGQEVLDYMERERDERLRTKSSLETFCEECLEVQDGNRIPMKDFQAAYRTYCERGRLAPVKGGYKALKDHLKDMGFDAVRSGNRFYVKHHAFVDFTDQ